MTMAPDSQLGVLVWNAADTRRKKGTKKCIRETC
jgi:hypothetical protein